jgi:glycosylphosphatidylinositol transamidase (GPIT) subunit GPI8
MFRRFNRGLDILIKRLSISLRYKSALFFVYHSNKQLGLPASQTFLMSSTGTGAALRRRMPRVV